MTQAELSRMMYSDMRRATKSPAMILFNLGNDTWYVEASTGEVMYEQLSGCCNAWEAKIKGALRWNEIHNPE